MKKLTEAKLTKMLIDLIPSYFDDIKKPNIKVEPATFEKIGLYPHPNNHYSFTIGEK